MVIFKLKVPFKKLNKKEINNINLEEDEETNCSNNYYENDNRVSNENIKSWSKH